MSDTSDPKRCPKCGLPIPDEAPQGLCPKCVLLQASIPTEGGKGQPAPSRDEVAAAFPQLEILDLIGQGGMGFVFKARQPKLERLVALKILPQALAADPEFAERFSREGRLLARLSHPNIVAIHDYGQAGGFFYLLMEFVDGVNLRQAMRAGRFTPAQALVVVPKICEALQFAHNEGILHRDIKPENILVDVRGRVKIADFGIAKLVGDAQPSAALTGSGGTLGTPHYMAPEQLEKPGTVDHRADIYSLGVVFYEMLTGELPLGRFQPPSHKVEMDVRLDEVVLHALEKEPSRRYQHASQVRTAVETIASGTAAAQVAPVSDRFWKRMAVAMALLCLTLIVLIACFARSFFATQRAVANLPTASVPVLGTEKQSATLVIDSVKYQYSVYSVVAPASVPSQIWHFNCLIPADHLAQMVFVLWTNGVPTIKPGLSAYFKVGQKPVVLGDMAADCETNSSGPHGETMAQWSFGPGFGRTSTEWISNQPPDRQLETAPRSVLHSGHQLAIRLAEFLQPTGVASNGWSGVELRLILEPLSSPAVQTDPNEVVGADYVGGFGLAGASEDSILKLMKELPIESAALQTQPTPDNSIVKQTAVPVAATESLSGTGLQNPTDSWSPTVAPGEKVDGNKLLQEAKSLTAGGQYEQALQRYLWGFNHALECNLDSSGVRLLWGYADWIELGRRYPKAKQAFIEIRDRDWRDLAEGRGYLALFMEVQNMDQFLQDDDATVTLFKRISANDPALAKQCFLSADGLLVEKGEYSLYMSYVPDPEAKFALIQRNWKMLKGSEDSFRQNNVAFPKSADNKFVVQTCQMIEALVATGHKAEAEKIRDKAMTEFDNEHLKSAVSDAEKKLGK